MGCISVTIGLNKELKKTMNYMLFRIIIFIIIILISAIVLRFIFNVRKRKIFAISIFIIFIIFIFICYYPIENKLFKFDSVDKAFRYYYPTANIRKKYEGNGYTYIVYDDKKSDIPGLMYFIKDDDNWIINNLFTMGNSRQKISDICTISTIELPKMNSAGIIMYYNPLFKKPDEKVYDSLSSSIETYEEEDMTINIIILNEKVDSNYTIYFGDKEYKLFKNN